MAQKEGFFVNKRNQKIFTRSWLPSAGEATKALVFLFHGLGEHSGRYAHVAAHFNARGYGVFALDHHGHGRSDGAPVHVERFEDYAEDALLFIDIVSASYPADLPKFILGHSMGGTIALLAAKERPTAWAGVVLSGPAIKKGDDVNALTLFAARFLSWAAPTLGIKQIDPSMLSTDPEQVKAYQDDPLVYHGKVTARIGHELFRAAGLVENNPSVFTFPLLLCHALDDKLTHPGGSQELYERAPAKVKDLILYSNMRHEIFNERDKEHAIADVLHWIEKRFVAEETSNVSSAL